MGGVEIGESKQKFPIVQYGIRVRAGFDKTTCENKESFLIEAIEHPRSFLSRLRAIAVVKIEAIVERRAWQDS
jgi:hypothetical protein